MEDKPLTGDDKIIFVTIKMCVGAAIATGQLIASAEPGLDTEQTAAHRKAVAAAILEIAAKAIISGAYDDLDFMIGAAQKMGGIQ